MPPKDKQELIPYQIEQLQKGLESIANDFDLVHTLDKKIDKLESDIAYLKKIVYGFVGIVLTAFAIAVTKNIF